MWVIGRLTTWPFHTNFFCIISLLILFCSDERTPDDNSAPSVDLVSSSSVELDDDDSDNLDTFFLAGLECTGIFLGAALIGEGERSFSEICPYMYGRSVVIKLSDSFIADLKDSGPHESFTKRSSETNIL